MYKKIINFVKFFIPPPEWQVGVIILLGIFCGLAGYVYYISNASAYMSSDPQACINCHVMTPQYATWQRSSHHRVASCVDCHVPHDSVFRKYEFKMKDGMRHSTIFTLRKEPQVIQIKKEGIGVVQENCIRCHSSILQETSLHDVTYNDVLKGKGKLCWDCHREVPHSTVHSLSATPFANVPETPGEAPNWMGDVINKFENIGK